MIHYGLPLNGGLVEVEQQAPPWSADRPHALAIVAFQALFFIVVGIFLLNILFAIIVDEFGRLRERRSLASTERFSRCLVCSIERETFQRKGIDYMHHVITQHNIVAYLYFFAHLKYTDVAKFGRAERQIYR